MSVLLGPQVSQPSSLPLSGVFLTLLTWPFKCSPLRGRFSLDLRLTHVIIVFPDAVRIFFCPWVTAGTHLSPVSCNSLLLFRLSHMQQPTHNWQSRSSNCAPAGPAFPLPGVCLDSCHHPGIPAYLPALHSLYHPVLALVQEEGPQSRSCLALCSDGWRRQEMTNDLLLSVGP